ncbi:MAG: hypothetical protein WC490_06650 [Candidatus Margulisiibacteriota bacterium]
MNNQASFDKTNFDLSFVARQIQLTNKLLAIVATDKDFSSHPQDRQISILGKMGFRQCELAEIFGVTNQYINNVFRKFKIKRS